jgi:hypothetical protein
MDARLHKSILRGYRHLTPTKFFMFNQGVRQSLANNDKIPGGTWGSNPNLLALYFEVSDKYNLVFHEATYGSSREIAEREILQQQLVNYLDEIAADLEAEAVRNPDILLFCGFELTKERRSHNRKKAPLNADEVTTGEHHGNNR